MGERRHETFAFGIDAAKDDALSAALSREHYLFEDERRHRHDVRNGFQLFGDRIVIAHAVLHAILNDDVSGRAEYFGLNVFFEAGHDSDGADQCSHAQGDSRHRNERIQ
jgi:hypothetical protein